MKATWKLVITDVTSGNSASSVSPLCCFFCLVTRSSYVSICNWEIENGVSLCSSLLQVCFIRFIECTSYLNCVCCLKFSLDACIQKMKTKKYIWEGRGAKTVSSKWRSFKLQFGSWALNCAGNRIMILVLIRFLNHSKVCKPNEPGKPSWINFCITCLCKASCVEITHH